MCIDDPFQGNDDNFPHSDEIYQAVKAELGGCDKISIGSTSTYELPVYYCTTDPLETLVALKVYPVDPIYDSEDLNQFAKERF